MIHKVSAITIFFLLGILSGFGETAGKLTLAGTSWSADTIAVTEIHADGSAWWRRFNDATLDSLIILGEKNNYDAAAAVRRIAIARAQLGTARSAWFPQIDVSAGYNRERSSGRLQGRTGNASTMSYFNAGASLSWEIDVFGKVARQVEKASEYVRLSAAEYGGVIVALDAEIASAYISLLVSRHQLEIAETHAVNQDSILGTVETRYRTGLASKLDVAQAKTLYYSTIASVPLLEASIEASYNSLAVLIGVLPDSLPSGVYADHPLPDHVGLPDVGVSADLLRRRPDIAQAERNISMAAAELGIARSQYLPSLSLTATIGTLAHNFNDLFSKQSTTYSISPTLSWTLFNGLSRRNSTAAAKENLQMQIDSYNTTVLTAVEEVNNALASYSASLRHIARLEQVLENCLEEVRLSFSLYKQGLTQFSNVVDAQQDYLTYQNTLVEAQGTSLASLISLYRALGGGWNE